MVSEPIDGHKEYHIVALQLGPTEASRYWIYWVPAQYVDAIKDCILGKWQLFWYCTWSIWRFDFMSVSRIRIVISIVWKPENYYGNIFDTDLCYVDCRKSIQRYGIS